MVFVLYPMELLSLVKSLLKAVPLLVSMLATDFQEPSIQRMSPSVFWHRELLRRAFSDTVNVIVDHLLLLVPMPLWLTAIWFAPATAWNTVVARIV